MRKTFALLLGTVLLVFGAAVPATGDSGAGELNASFHGGLGGGVAIDLNSGAAAGVASPQINPEGRFEPFGADESICDELVVGTWVFVFDIEKDLLEGFTNEFKLDGELLDTTRTPLKRITDPEFRGWWFAEGVPVLGTLDPGLHEIEWSFDDGFGFADTVLTDVDVDAAHC